MKGAWAWAGEQDRYAHGGTPTKSILEVNGFISLSNHFIKSKVTNSFLKEVRD